jgi:hypothetical protein
MSQSVPRPALSRTPLSAPPHADSRLPDDAFAEETNLLADRLARDRDALATVIDYINASTITEPNHNRKRARRALGLIWTDLVQVSRALAQPAPKFRPNVTGPRPIVRHHQLDAELIAGVEDVQFSSLPALLEASL